MASVLPHMKEQKMKASTLKQAIEQKQKAARNLEEEMDRLGPVFNAGVLFNLPVEQLPVEQKVAAHALLKAFVEMFGERVDQFKAGLFQDADKLGVPNENGSMILDVEGTRVMKVRSAKESINPDKLKAILKEANIKDEDVFKVKTETVTKTTVAIDESMLEALVTTGKLSAEKLQSAKETEERFQLRVNESEEIEKLLEVARSRMAALPPRDGKQIRSGKKK